MHLIQLHDVNKSYSMGSEEIRALRDVQLDIPRGDFIVIVGPSGSGKTTMLNLIGGLEAADSGDIVVDGEDITAYDENALTQYRRHKVGLVFQFFNLIPTLTALENVHFAAELVGDHAASPAEILELVGLGDRMHHYPGQLSGGQQQRVAIARALVKNPALVLADEPTGSLDTETGKEVLVAMRRINRERGQTFVLVTHNTAISTMADHIVEMSSGRVHEVSKNLDPRSTQELRW